jgi:GlcNAc-P-P-Und epimerase|tara:strand:+ start:8346 stop:9296 length:951 start_codon:yes stop_codon:yes gene_type:complete
MREKIIITGGSGFIGTNFIERYSDIYSIHNIDKNPPRNKTHFRYWINQDITNLTEMQSIIKNINPKFIIHLAARTDLKGKSAADYIDNTVGTQNLICAVKGSSHCERIIFASSKFVVPNGYSQKHIYDYRPNTVYGASKVEMERLIRSSNIEQTWCILRPTSIWGEWFDQPYKEFFNRVLSGNYVNFTGNSALKTFGYVGNTVFQIKSILEADDTLIDRSVFYLGDYDKITVNEWATKIAIHNNGRIINLPILTLRTFGYIGDILNKLGLSFPVSSFRVKNMTTDCVNDLTSTMQAAPNLPYSIAQGIRNTVRWLR